MDVFNHGLWSYAFFFNKKRKDRIAAVAFGTLPDIIAFTPAVLYMFFQGHVTRVPFDGLQGWVFDFAYGSYNFTHSLVVFAASFLVVWAVRRKVYWPMTMWGLHILMDIPTHPNYFPTPMFFPLSDYHLTGGMSWHNPIIFFPNYGLLIIVFIILWYRARKKKAKAS